MRVIALSAAVCGKVLSRAAGALRSAPGRFSAFIHKLSSDDVMDRWTGL